MDVLVSGMVMPVVEWEGVGVEGWGWREVVASEVPSRDIGAMIQASPDSAHADEGVSSISIG